VRRGRYQLRRTDNQRNNRIFRARKVYFIRMSKISSYLHVCFYSYDTRAFNFNNNNSIIIIITNMTRARGNVFIVCARKRYSVLCCLTVPQRLPNHNEQTAVRIYTIYLSLSII
jgi:hypothetical protein